MYYLAMLPALETPSLKDFFLMLGRALLLGLPFFILMKIFPALKNENFEQIAGDLILLAVIYPLAGKLGFKFSAVRSYLGVVKAELKPAFNYFLVMEVLLLGAYYAFTLALAPWDLPWTNTLLFWSEQSSNPATLDSHIAALLENPLLLPFYFLSICAFAPLIEEFLMRRWLYTAMRARMPVAAAIIINGSLFGLMHGKDFIAAAMHGFFLCWSYEKTGKIETPILVHAFTNLLALLLIFGEKIFNFSL